MGQAFYYFAASLPMLHFDREPPMTLEKFLENCQALLPLDDYRFVNRLMSYEQDKEDWEIDRPSYQKIFQANRNFHNALAAFRAERDGKDPASYIRGYKFKNDLFDEVFHQASKMTELMESQHLIDRTKWQYLDDEIIGHHNDIEFISVYGLKLKILDHYKDAQSTKGSEKLEYYKNLCLGDSKEQEIVANDRTVR